MQMTITKIPLPVTIITNDINNTNTHNDTNNHTTNVNANNDTKNDGNNNTQTGLHRQESKMDKH